MSIPPDDGNEPVTEKICELKRKDVGQLGETLKAFRKDFKDFKDNEFHDLVSSLSGMRQQVADVCKDMGNQGARQDAHETSHSRNTKFVSLIVQGGSLLVAFISLGLLALNQFGIIGGKP